MRKYTIPLLLLILAVLLVACPGGGAAPTATPQPQAEQPTQPPQPQAEQPTQPPAQAVEDPWGVVELQAGEPIKIGFAAGLSGEVANLGIDMQYGAQLAVEDMPEIMGHPVELVVEDAQCSGEGGTAVAQKFASDPTIVGVVGHMCSSSSIPASDIYEENRIVMVSPSSTAVDLTARGLQVVNRVAWNDAVQGSAAADYIFTQLGIRNVAIIHDGSAYGQGLVDVFRDAFSQLGGQIVAYEGITVGDKDFRAVLTRIAAQQPELIYFGGFQAEGALLVSQKNEVGLEEVIFFGADGIKSAQYIEAAGGAAEGSYATFADLPAGSPDLERFRQRYEEKFGVKPADMGPFHAHAYDATMVILRAIEQVAVLQDDGTLLIPRKALADAVRNTKNYQGLSGTISCDDKGDCGSATVVVNQVQNGDWVRVWPEAGAETTQPTAELPDLGGREITIGSDTAYPPFEFVDENGNIVGFDVDMMDAVCELVNCQPQFVTTAFDGIFAALAAGEFDAVVSAVTITAERAEIVDFTRPYLNAGQIVTVRSDTTDINGPEDLADKIVGVQLGTTGDIAASDYTAEENIRRYQTIDVAMAALAQGDIDAVIADAPTSADIVEKQFKGQLKLVGEPFTEEYYGIAVRKETPELTEAFNAALEVLIQNGTLQELANTWGLPESSVQNLPESGLQP
ncbi:MAG: transporter substrate-binding domain-containing protein [Ardenticatenia bacterium]|nr:transporter substrate-binding domain-containing protein [Ardenticatenia bacterium]